MIIDNDTKLVFSGIIKKLEGRNTVLKVALVAVVSVGAVIAIRRLKILWKERQMKKMRDAILRNRSQIDTDGLSDIQICTVCLVNPKEVILLNCGHVCVCADCCLKLNSKCPVCRSEISSTHPAFIV
jgi:E3 ubiquitin-protein ligase MUL1